MLEQIGAELDEYGDILIGYNFWGRNYEERLKETNRIMTLSSISGSFTTVSLKGNGTVMYCVPVQCILGHAFEYGDEIEARDGDGKWKKCLFHNYRFGGIYPIYTSHCYYHYARPIRKAKTLTLSEYSKAVDGFCSNSYAEIDRKLLHGIIGCVTEAGELLDAIKKSMFYGKEIDRINIIEELGDLCWYLQLTCNAMDVSMEEVMSINVKKLTERYKGKGFSEHDANNRDLDAERDVLESGCESKES